MTACGRKVPTLLSSVFTVCGISLLAISVSTDYWLYPEEGIIQPQNQAAEIKLSLHSGLWRVCFLAGLSLVVGLLLYISSNNDEILSRTKDSETFFNYKYRWSFAFSAISFLLTESVAVISIYLFMRGYTADDNYRPHLGFYRPRLNNGSDYSAQFLHLDALPRGRSPSDISSEASLQMNSNYPAVPKCPDYDQMSSSPCRAVPALHLLPRRRRWLPRPEAF
ncbi:voltage-dependent calcium channel gamma-5 subunit [Morus bassanus]